MQYESFGGQVARTTRRVMKITMVAIVVAAILFLSLMYWGVYDEGVRAGTVLRISKKGMVFKTFEGQLNVQTFGALGGSNPIVEAFNFFRIGGRRGSDQRPSDRGTQWRKGCAALSGAVCCIPLAGGYKIFYYEGGAPGPIT